MGVVRTYGQMIGTELVFEPQHGRGRPCQNSRSQNTIQLLKEIFKVCSSRLDNSPKRSLGRKFYQTSGHFSLTGMLNIVSDFVAPAFVFAFKGNLDQHTQDTC